MCKIMQSHFVVEHFLIFTVTELYVSLARDEISYVRVDENNYNP